MTCDICDFACGRIKCETHTLMLGVVKDLHQAMLDGQSWGDIEYEWAEERMEAETPAQKAQRLLKAQVEEMKRAEGLRKVREEKYINNQSGKLMTLARPRACKYVNEPETTDRFGVKWEAGCQHHKKGMCPYLHPGQPGYEQVAIKRSPLTRW